MAGCLQRFVAQRQQLMRKAARSWAAEPPSKNTHRAPPQNVSLINRTARSDSIFGWETVGARAEQSGDSDCHSYRGSFRGNCLWPYPALSLLACGGSAGFRSPLGARIFRFLFAKNLAIGAVAWRTDQKVFDDPIAYSLGRRS